MRRPSLQQKQVTGSALTSLWIRECHLSFCKITLSRDTLDPRKGKRNYQLISSYRGHYYVAKLNHALLRVIRNPPKIANMCIVWYLQHGYFHDLCPRRCIGTGRFTGKLVAKRYHDHGFYGVSHQIIESDAGRKTVSAASNDEYHKTSGKSNLLDPHW